MQQTKRRADIKIDTYVAPWVLPKEDIPAYVKWYEDVAFDKITVTIPEDMEFVEFLNVNLVEIAGNRAEIKEVGTTSSLPHYFGFVVRSSRIPESLKLAKFVKIEFKSNGQTIFAKELCCRIFRPNLEVVTYPESIEVTDEQKCVLPLHLKFTGFGDILLKMEASIGGGIVSYGDSILYELVRRLWLSTLKKETKKRLEKGRTGLRIAPNYVRKIADEVKEKVDQGKLPLAGLTEKEVGEVKEWWSDIKDRGERLDAFSAFYDRIGEILLDILIDVLERNPTSNVRLSDPRTKIITKISAPVERLKLTLRYRDVLENHYRPLEVSVRLIDNRTVNKETLVDIPIKIEKWDNDPFYNVENIDMSR